MILLRVSSSPIVHWVSAETCDAIEFLTSGLDLIPTYDVSVETFCSSKLNDFLQASGVLRIPTSGVIMLVV
ncbi:hypothetical protein FXO37_30191 [Capsicum annuum]|nr:hypothetical protein FXO37_30191 [Capsicum annuum]